MTMDDYNKAYKAGKKDYQARLLRGEQPTLKIGRASCRERV